MSWLLGILIESVAIVHLLQCDGKNFMTVIRGIIVIKKLQFRRSFGQIFLVNIMKKEDICGRKILIDKEFINAQK